MAYQVPWNAVVVDGTVTVSYFFYPYIFEYTIKKQQGLVVTNPLLK